MGSCCCCAPLACLFMCLTLLQSFIALIIISPGNITEDIATCDPDDTLYPTCHCPGSGTSKDDDKCIYLFQTKTEEDY